jgi:hypothetical protein
VNFTFLRHAPTCFFSVNLKIDTLYDDLPSSHPKEETTMGTEETKLDRMIGSLKLKDHAILVERFEKKLATQVSVSDM